jgi:PRTRC genetic system protein E
VPGDRAEAARRLGWSRAKLDRRLTLAELCDAAKLALDERRIKVGHAELLAAIPGDKQDKALDTILKAGLDVAKTRELLMRVTQNLAAACFDKTECTTCPFNSGTQRVLFETHVDDGSCTNPTCFQLKNEAAETIRFEEEERTAKAARAAAPATVDPSDDDEQDGPVDETDVDHADDADDTLPSADETTGPRASVPSIAATPAGSAASAQKPAVTAESIARRTADLREAIWRTALARTLASNASHAQITILVAAMSGTLSQIKADTLTSRAGLLVGATFPDLDYGAQIATIRGLPDRQAQIVLAVIGAAYAKDVVTFGHVADLAKAFEVDLRDSWKVDQAFLDRYTKEELKFIARECGLVAHIGQKAFAKRLAGKKSDLITSMLNAIGFDWSGRLPSAMTLDCTYGPPPRLPPRKPNSRSPTSQPDRIPPSPTQGLTAMLIASLLPLLTRYSLGLDLVAGPDDTVTLTVIPRKAEGAGAKLEAGETRPISITASAAEIDAELAKGPHGALGELIATRKTLADQLAEQRQAAEAARTAAAEVAKAKAAAASKTTAPTGAAKVPVRTSPPADAKPDEPATLF